MNPQIEDHPAAALFPLQTKEQFADLTESIAAYGWDKHHPIVLCDGKILDGRHRYRACLSLEVEPTFREHVGNPYSLAWMENGARRDLKADQKTAIRLLVRKASGEWERRQGERGEMANRARSETQSGRPRGERALSHDNAGSGDPWRCVDCGETFSVRVVHCPHDDHHYPKEDGECSNCHNSLARLRQAEHRGDNCACKELAAETGVSRATAARVLAIDGKRPDLTPKIAQGEISATEAARQINRERVRDAKPLPDGKFRILYADPPWKYNDSRASLSGYSATAADDHYPTMSVPELCALDVKALAADDAVLFCWATFPLLPDALEVVRAWGFRYKTSFVWAKGRPNFGHYHNASAELLLVCTRGSCTPDADRREDQVQQVERTGRHSAKPEDFRDLIERLYQHGERVELFRRGEAPDGWTVWGNEVAP